MGNPILVFGQIFNKVFGGFEVTVRQVLNEFIDFAAALFIKDRRFPFRRAKSHFPAICSDRFYWNQSDDPIECLTMDQPLVRTMRNLYPR